MARAGRVSALPLSILPLLAAFVLYALWGTPTPDHPAIIELLIGTGLALAALRGLNGVFAPDGGVPWRLAAQALLLYGMTVPLVGGVMAGNEASYIVRDLAAFLFLMMPLFFYSGLRDERALRWVTGAAVFIGLAFAARVIIAALPQGDAFWHPADPAYLANAPTVLFAAMFLGGMAGWFVYHGAGMRRWMAALAALAAALLPFVTMALIVQRASIGLAALGFAGLLLGAFIRRPYRALPLCLAVCVVMVAAAPFLVALYETFAAKTAMVGMNMRAQETRAVFDVLGDDIAAALFGRGWGGTVVSPAAGIAYPVNFTHNIMTTYALKTGLVGVMLLGWYLWGLARLLWPLILAFPVMAVALAVPFVIDVTLYASFKSLDFGIILLLLALWGGRAVSLRAGRVYNQDAATPIKAPHGA